MPSIAELRRDNPWAKDYSDEELIFEFSKQTGTAAADAAGMFGYQAPSSSLGKSLASGVDRYQAGMQHIGAALGSDTMARWARQNEAQAQLVDELNPAVKSIAGVNSVGDFGSYLAHGAAQSVPYLVEAATTGLAGRGLNLVARGGMAAANTMGRGAIERRAAELISRDAALGGEAALQQATQDIARGYAGTGAMAAGTYPSSVGAILARQQQETGEYDLGAAAALGVPYAAANVVGLEGQMLRGLPRSSLQSWRNRAALGTLEGAIPEAGSEMFQTGLERTGAGLDAFGPGAGVEYADSAILGGFLGGVPGGVSAAARRSLSAGEQVDLLKLGERRDGQARFETVRSNFLDSVNATPDPEIGPYRTPVDTFLQSQQPRIAAEYDLLQQAADEQRLVREHYRGNLGNDQPPPAWSNAAVHPLQGTDLEGRRPPSSPADFPEAWTAQQVESIPPNYQFQLPIGAGVGYQALNPVVQPPEPAPVAPSLGSTALFNAQGGVARGAVPPAGGTTPQAYYQAQQRPAFALEMQDSQLTGPEPRPAQPVSPSTAAPAGQRVLFDKNGKPARGAVVPLTKMADQALAAGQITPEQHIELTNDAQLGTPWPKFRQRLAAAITETAQGVPNGQQVAQSVGNAPVAQAVLQPSNGELYDANPTQVPAQGQGQVRNAQARKVGVQPRTPAGRRPNGQGQDAAQALQEVTQAQEAALDQEASRLEAEATAAQDQAVRLARTLPTTSPVLLEAQTRADRLQTQLDKARKAAVAATAAREKTVKADSETQLVRDSIYGALEDASLTDEQVQAHVDFLYEQSQRGTGKAKAEAAEAIRILTDERDDGALVEKAKAKLAKIKKSEADRDVQNDRKQALEEQVSAFNPENAVQDEQLLDKDWEQFRDRVADAKTLGDALDRIMTAPFVSSSHKLLARALAGQKAIREAGFTISREFRTSRNGDGLALGHYDPDKHHVYVHAGGGTLSALHEAVHAAVYGALEVDPVFRRKMTDLFLQVRSALKGRADAAEYYGMTDLQEFVAEAFANPEFQKLLGEIPSRSRALPRASTSLWQAFVTIVRAGLKLFGVNRTVLDDVITVASPYMQGYTEGGGQMAAREVKLAENLQRAADRIAPGKSTSLEQKLNWLTLRQIAKRYGDKLVGIKTYVDNVFERAAATTARVNTLTPLAERLDGYIRGTKDRVKLLTDPKSEEAPLAALLLDGDTLEVDVRPDHQAEALKRYVNDPAEDAAEKHAAVQAMIERYNALPAEAKALYNDMRAHFEQQAADTYDAMRTMVNALIRDPKVRAARIADLSKWYAARVTGYFPHMRFGDFFVSYREGGERYVEAFESEREADARMAELAQDTGVIDATMRRRSDVQQNNSFDLVTDLTQAIDKLDIDGETKQTPGALKQEIKDTLQEVWMKNLPEFSGAKFRLKRSGTKGYADDVVRALTAQGQRMSRHIAHMQFMPAINAALVDMRDEVSGYPSAYVLTAMKDKQPVALVFKTRSELQAWMSDETQGAARDPKTKHFTHQDIAFARVGALEEAADHFAGADIPEADRPMDALKPLLAERTTGDLSEKGVLFNHIRKINALNAQTEPNEIIDRITQLGWVYHLGLTPSFALINSLQVPAIHTPWLAARAGGIGRAVRHTWDAYKLVGRNLGNLAKATWKEDVLKALEKPLGKNSDQLKMLRRMMERNLIDFTTSYDLTAMARGEAGSWSDNKRQALKVASYAAQYTEVINRLVTALSTYNAVRAQGKSYDAAVALAERALEETQGDYSPENTPYAMDRRRTGFLALAFQFQKYRQFTLYGLVDNVMKAFSKTPEERQVARATLVGWAVSNGALFGTLGVPAAYPLLWVLSALGSDDDEPIDPVRDLKRFYGAITGSDEMAEVLTHGMFRTIGVSTTGRAGMGDLIPGSRGLIDPKQTSEQDYSSTMQAMAFDIFAGPAGGIANNVANAYAYFVQGNWYRGMESMAPKAVKDVLAAARYADEGVMTRAGTTQLLPEVDADAILAKALGFTPAEVANLYENRGSVQAIADHLNQGKTRIKNDYVIARMFGDSADVNDAMAAWQKWNATHQGKARVSYSDLVKAVQQARTREAEAANSGGVYSSKLTRQLVQSALE